MCDIAKQNPYLSRDRLPAAPDVPQCLTNDPLCLPVNPALPFLSRGKTPLKRLFPLTWRPLVQFRNTTRGNKSLCRPLAALPSLFFSWHRPVHPIAPPPRATPSAETNQPSSRRRSWRATLWGDTSICLRYWSLLRKVLRREKTIGVLAFKNISCDLSTLLCYGRCKQNYNNF